MFESRPSRMWIVFFSHRHSERTEYYALCRCIWATLIVVFLLAGIAVDWLAQNLYWTDFQLNHIGVSRYDGSSRRIFLKDDIQSPRSIVIHAGER